MIYIIFYVFYFFLLNVTIFFMDYGFIRVACASPELIVANCVYNADKIIDYVRDAAQNGASLIVFPELSITSCSCGDLFFQQSFLLPFRPSVFGRATSLHPLNFPFQ